jgi:hypothetical protein
MELLCQGAAMQMLEEKKLPTIVTVSPQVNPESLHLYAYTRQLL